MIDLPQLRQQLPQLTQAFRAARPFPHVVIDNLCSDAALRRVSAAFPAVDDHHWIHYIHYNEKKHGLNRLDVLPPVISDLISEMNSPAFVSFLSELTGFDGLLPDPELTGGGLHQSERGGFLRIHSDFLSHPRKQDWHRQLNVLLYLNERWEDRYGGHLELWAEDMSECQVRISPIFNRCVIFHTHETSFHGHPEPLACPANMTRKSIALYYYTQEPMIRTQATIYRARPRDRRRKVLIGLDNLALHVYHRLRMWLGLRDGMVSRLLGRFTQRKK